MTAAMVTPRLQRTRDLAAEICATDHPALAREAAAQFLATVAVLVRAGEANRDDLPEYISAMACRAAAIAVALERAGDLTASERQQ